MKVLTLTTYREKKRRFRLQCDKSNFVPEFITQLKELVPGFSRSYFSKEQYWLIEPVYFMQVFELAMKWFDQIHGFVEQETGDFKVYALKVNRNSETSIEPNSPNTHRPEGVTSGARAENSG